MSCRKTPRRLVTPQFISPVVLFAALAAAGSATAANWEVAPRVEAGYRYSDNYHLGPPGTEVEVAGGEADAGAHVPHARSAHAGRDHAARGGDLLPRRARRRLGRLLPRRQPARHHATAAHGRGRAHLAPGRHAQRAARRRRGRRRPGQSGRRRFGPLRRAQPAELRSHRAVLPLRRHPAPAGRVRCALPARGLREAASTARSRTSARPACRRAGVTGSRSALR